eukprot:TRINITY_DN17476_c0_g1_i1.p1 TRINITY_DN17476_c0_g1~~TRINITY_DN17476_c0_g1_i1.p1  ORF type:complete len:304 (+),score=67.90 TRINITY_DN17476_c0_g1_i1:257-1168(+)
MEDQSGGFIEIRQCHTVRELGKGSFGSVSLALRPDGKFVAVKRVKVSKDEGAGAQVTDFVKEVGVMKMCKHKNIVEYFGSSYEETVSEFVLMIFQEYVTGGSASTLCKSLQQQRVQFPDPDFDEDVNGIPYEPLRVFSRHITEGLEYLHGKDIAHRDLKGDNVLISHDTGVAKLADFGAAHSLHATMAGRNNSVAKTFIGTPYWMAPEVIVTDGGYDAQKADIWSLGCTVAEMWTGASPWKPQKQLMTTVYAIAKCRDWPDNIPKAKCPDLLKEFLNICFVTDPKQRSSSTRLLQTPFLNHPY